MDYSCLATPRLPLVIEGKDEHVVYNQNHEYRYEGTHALWARWLRHTGLTLR